MSLRARVKFSALAQHDLDEIFVWITRDSSEERAEIIAAHIYLSIDRLASLPGIGRVRQDLPGHPQSYIIAPWLVLYRSHDREGGITILRVIDGRRNIPNVLKTEGRP